MTKQKSHQHNNECKHLSCCLKKEPTPLSENFQKMRKAMAEYVYENVNIAEGEKIIVTEDMIVGDIIRAYPSTQELFADVNPLGLKSYSIGNESIALFLAGTGIDVTKFCKDLNHFINNK